MYATRLTQGLDCKKTLAGPVCRGHVKNFCFETHTGKHAPAGTAQAAGIACGRDPIAPAKKACFSVRARPVQGGAQKSGRAGRLDVYKRQQLI